VPVHPGWQQFPPVYPINLKSLGVAYSLLIFLGFWGAHQFDLGKPVRGCLYFFTAGLFGAGWLFDLFTLPAQVRQVNAELAATGRR